jgi:hypothetical protein
MKSINHVPSPLSPSFTSPPPISTSPIVPILQSCNIKVDVQRHFSMYSCCECTLLWSLQSLSLLSLIPLPSTPPLFNSIQYISLWNNNFFKIIKSKVFVHIYKVNHLLHFQYCVKDFCLLWQWDLLSYDSLNKLWIW